MYSRVPEKREHVPPRPVGPLVELEVFPQIDRRPGINPSADDLFDLRVDQMPFGGQKRIVARVVRSAERKSMQGVGAEHRVDLRHVEDVRIGNIHRRAAIADASRQGRA